MKHFITFGDENFEFQKLRIATEARWFDSVTIESPETIKEYLHEHELFVKNNKRGYGYWIWKPYILERKLEEIDDGDYLIFMDAGGTVLNKDFDRYEKILQEKDIITFALHEFALCKFIKMRTIKEFNLTANSKILDFPIVESGCIILKKTQFTTGFIKQWKTLCLKDNYSLVTDELFNEPQHEKFIEHRHDQSILSVLCRLNENKVHVAHGEWELYENGPFFSSRITDHGLRKYAKRFKPSLYTPKKYIIVGNAKCLIGKNLGHFIDSHDVVIRMNDGITNDNFKNDFGTRTDFRFSYKEEKFLSNKSNFYFTNSELDKLKCHDRIDPYNIQKKLDENFYKNGVKYHAMLSTGIACIIYFLNKVHEKDEVSIINFDYQKNLTHDIHYWEPSTKQYWGIDTVYNFPMEREIIRSFKNLKILEP
jgi:hypothetical protein